MSPISCFTALGGAFAAPVLLQADADAVSVAKGVLVAASVRQHTAAFCSASEGVLSSLGLGSE